MFRVVSAAHPSAERAAEWSLFELRGADLARAARQSGGLTHVTDNEACDILNMLSLVRLSPFLFDVVAHVEYCVSPPTLGNWCGSGEGAPHAAACRGHETRSRGNGRALKGDDSHTILYFTILCYAMLCYAIL